MMKRKQGERMQQGKNNALIFIFRTSVDHRKYFSNPAFFSTESYPENFVAVDFMKP